MATPLTAAGESLSEEALDQLVDFLIGRGVNGLFVGGTTGEGVLFDPATRMRLHERAIRQAAGRVPLLLHVGANTTAESVALADHARQLDADAIVAVTPYFYAMDDDALYDYYATLAAAAPGTPLLAYDIPQMAANGIGPALLLRLASTLPTFAGLKTSRPDVQAVRVLVDAAPADLLVLAGNERAALGLLALGAKGLISGLATAVPEPFVALTRAYAAGDLAEAGRQQRLINQILDMVPPAWRIGGLKAVLAERGIAAGPAVPPRPMPPNGWRIWPEISRLLNSDLQ
jgi:dihydrodipicolinate synthase/N-acetylneuraminate lyase